jgi:hypothetical protein
MKAADIIKIIVVLAVLVFWFFLSAVSDAHSSPDPQRTTNSPLSTRVL